MAFTSAKSAAYLRLAKRERSMRAELRRVLDQERRHVPDPAGRVVDEHGQDRPPLARHGARPESPECRSAHRSSARRSSPLQPSRRRGCLPPSSDCRGWRPTTMHRARRGPASARARFRRARDMPQSPQPHRANPRASRAARRVRPVPAVDRVDGVEHRSVHHCQVQHRDARILGGQPGRRVRFQSRTASARATRAQRAASPPRAQRQGRRS